MSELLLRGTAWLSLLAWAGSEWARTRGGSAASVRRARVLFTTGGALLLVHALVALHTRHGWSQAAALRDTARQTEAVTGLAVGAGLFVNYGFVLLWLAEIAWWWRSPGRYVRRARAVDRAVRGFFLFMFANGAFVFVRGPARWLGAAVLIVVLAAWYRGAGAGTTNG
jgi:hypothetical protein